ncbi:MAG: DUF5606 domain-containing protein [Rikenellaceae bacterium]|nr:DUF5606 domain-containing protein [Rikenellaceae bacterium]
MELKDILAISGQPGLYKYIAQSKNGIIVEALSDGRRSNAPSSAKVSALAEIAVYTDTEEVPLSVIFTKMFEKFEGGQAISHKASPEELKTLIAGILPDYDRDRVHVSDMKKMVAWYNILVAAGMTDFSVDQPQEAEGENPAPEEAAE